MFWAMSPTDLLPVRGIADAKAKLPYVVNEAVHQHRPSVITRHGQSQAVVIGIADQREALRSYVFEPRVVIGDDVVITLDRHGLVASAPSLSEAIDAMVDELRLHAADYLDRHDYFRYTQRAGEFPWLLRFALTPPGEQRQLLIEEPENSRSPAAPR